jgi:hypothetical protein
MAFLLQSESAVVLVHVVAQPAAFTRSTFQLAMFWLKAVAPENIESMLVALAVFQLLTSPLKADADWKAPTLRGKGNAPTRPKTYSSVRAASRGGGGGGGGGTRQPKDRS